MNWTDEDKNRLRLLAGTMPRREIAAAMGRPKSAVKRMAYDLGIRKLSSNTPGGFKVPPRGRLWSDAEVARLRDLAGTTSTLQIAAALGRPEHSIKGKARGLGLRLKTYGEACSWAKYSDETCERARALHQAKVTLPEISRRLSIPYHALHSIIYFKRGRRVIELARVTPRAEGLFSPRVISLETPIRDGLRLGGLVADVSSPDPLNSLLEMEGVESIIRRLVAERGLDPIAARAIVEAYL